MLVGMDTMTRSATVEHDGVTYLIHAEQVAPSKLPGHVVVHGMVSQPRWARGQVLTATIPEQQVHNPRS